MRTYLYKLTSDRGGAPCAPEPRPGEAAWLSLAICKPAIRRTAAPGDRILGITSRSLAQSDGYPLLSVIYAAVVGERLGAREYFAETYAHRPDCVYEFHQADAEAERAVHMGRSGLHAAPEHMLKDLGRYPLYRNGQVLVCREFRYFGAGAVKIPARLRLLRTTAETLGQGHRVFGVGTEESREADALFRVLWKRQTGHTPARVEGDAYDHASRGAAYAG